MIRYERCSELDMGICYEAFNKGFQDYFIKTALSQEQFVRRFFGPEGNAAIHSFVALDEESPIGIALGGIRMYSGFRTLRCGGMSIDPAYRKKGVGSALFKHHLQESADERCEQLYLEVITTNYPALLFYEKFGYEKVYDLIYYLLSDVQRLLEQGTFKYTVAPVPISDLREIREQLSELHLNWQNEIETITLFEDEHFYGVSGNNSLDGVLSISGKGMIHFLWVHPLQRGRGMAKSLLAHAIKQHEPEKIRVSFSNNLKLTRFFNQMGFEKEPVAQYEMIAAPRV